MLENKIQRAMSSGRWFSFQELATEILKTHNGERAIGFMHRLINEWWLILSEPSMSKEEAHDYVRQNVKAVESKNKENFVPFSMRMDSRLALALRLDAGLTLKAKDKSCPRIFGGKWEDDVFASHPLHEVVVITYRAQEVDVEELCDIARELGMFPVASHEEGFVRVHGVYPVRMIQRATEKGWKHSALNVSRRRELHEFDKQFLEELYRFYVAFLFTPMKSRMPYIHRFVPPEEVPSQFMEWITSAIRMYDHNSGVPFGAYTLGLSRRIAYSIPKTIYGTAITSLSEKMLKAKKALEAIELEDTDENMAMVLGMTERDFKKLKNDVTLLFDIKEPKVSIHQPVYDSSNAVRMLGEVIADNEEPEPMPELTEILINKAPNMKTLANTYQCFFGDGRELKPKEKLWLASLGSEVSQCL